MPKSAVTIVSIWGGTGSGKTTLAKSLAAQYPDLISRVPMDRYILPRSGTLASVWKKPLRFDWSLFRSQLDKSKLGDEVHVPLFDYDDFTRPELKSKKSFIIKPLLLLDALAPCPFADEHLFLDVEAEMRKKRVKKRDAEHGLQIMQRWEWLEFSLFFWQQVSNFN